MALLYTLAVWSDHGWTDDLQATRILAQLMVAGATVVFRAATQAWGQALASEWFILPAGLLATGH